MQGFKRKTYSWVDRSHQYRFLALVLVYSFAIVVFLAITLFVPDFMTLQDKSLSFDVRAMTAERVLYLHSRVWPTVIAMICLFGLHSFRFFLRFVGPLVRFRWAFDQIRTGNLNFQIRLRKKDHLHKEESNFNEMLQVLAVKVGKTQSSGRSALKMIDELLQKETVEEGAGEDLVKRLRAVRVLLEELVENADYFHLEGDPREESPIIDLIGLSGAGTANTH